MDLDASSSILHTPSLMTPDINICPMLYKLSHEASTADVINNHNDGTSATTPTLIATKRIDESLSNEIKLSKIKDDLKQSFIQSRKPTESLFQKLAKAGALTNINTSLISTHDDGIPSEIPSTAEVMNEIESFTKYSNQDNTERETTIIQSDNNSLDTSITQHMGVIVSPKKKLLIRSQSHTEPGSPLSVSTNIFSQSQRTNPDDASSMDDDQSSYCSNDFQRVNEFMHSMDSKTQFDDNTKQLATDQNEINSTVIKQQTIITSNKRTYQQATGVGSISKINTNIISPPTIKSEVSSTNQSIGVKRQKTNTRSSTSSNNDINNPGSDDDRKKHIRDSNREAARRCRERRRQYIEQLEGNLEQCKLEIRQLNEKLSRVERENTQLRAILTEAKVFFTVPNLPSTDSMTESINVISPNTIDFNNESTDGNILQRSYFTKNTH